MHDIEPFYNWRHLYKVEYDERSPFFGKHYNNYEYTQQIYNFFIHPQWDNIGSESLYIKILYVDYMRYFAIIEMFGEWNDAINNDIKHLKRTVIDELLWQGIKYFILIGENVLIFHSSDDAYYEEWWQELENDGWIFLLNFRQHVLNDMRSAKLNQYLIWSDEIGYAQWRTTTPDVLFYLIQKFLSETKLLRE